jgi:tetratricopeptide (TPR) repeat protein
LEDQIIYHYFFYVSKLERGQFSDVKKFLSSKTYQKQFKIGNGIVKLFLACLKLSFLYEIEDYTQFNPIDEKIFAKEAQIENNKSLQFIFALLILFQSYFCYKRGLFNEYALYEKKCNVFKDSLENNYFSAIYSQIYSQIYVLKGDMTSALSMAQQCHDYAILTKNLKLKAISLLRLAHMYYPKGQIQQALDNCENSFMIGKKIGNNKLLGQVMLTNGKIFHQTGDLEQSLGFCSKAQDYFNTIEFSYGITEILNLKGGINHLKGELDEALKYFKKAYSEAEKNQDLFSQSMILNNIGNIHSDKGLFEQAIKEYELSYDLASKIQYTFIISVVLGNLGYNYHLKADYSKAIKYYSLSLEKSEQIGKTVHLADIYFNLVLLHIETNSDKLNDYYNKLRILTTKDDNKLIYYYFEIARGLVLKQKDRLGYIVEAQEIFKRLMKEDIPHAGLKQMLIVNLADLMVKELLVKPDPEIFLELNNLVEKLYNHGREKQIFHIIVESLILKSKITLVEGNLKQSERLLVQASIMAEERNLTYLVKKSEKEYSDFRKQVDHWKGLLEKNAPLVQKLQDIEIQKYISDLQKIAFK